ncbi:XRE family transcriptional regulator [Sphaerisporangium album]|uniref:XRE family transcriptional regulator n=2 Tax=Sphaerisporangium album TaxID=509200 RepID=A0A367EXS2_9ACTN|nr:XRE family transcriptional regulator [Sphaerisporangium album]
MSRQELADLVNAWVHERLGRVACLTANYIGKLERGLVSWPNADYRAALRDVLGACADRDLGFRRPRRHAPGAITVADVDRKDFLRAALGTALSVPLADLLASTEPPTVPAVVTPADVQEIRTIAGLFTTWDHTYGGSLVREAVNAQLRQAVALLDKARCPARLHDDLHAAVGVLGHAAGFMAFDAYAHNDARRMFRLALACAEEADDWHLRAKVLSSMARQAIWCGDPDTGMTLVELALVRSDRLTPAERAMLLSARARALAKLGRFQVTVNTVGLADEEFARVRPEEEAPWMRYYDAAQHSGDTGHALFDIALQERCSDEASRRLTAAVHGHSPVYVRSRAISGIKLATLTMATGDPDEAATIGGHAVRDAGTVRSRRAADDLRELYRMTASHQRRDSVAELRGHIKEAVRA